jgi:hypothetical protein
VHAYIMGFRYNSSLTSPSNILRASVLPGTAAATPVTTDNSWTFTYAPVGAPNGPIVNINNADGAL